MHPNQPRAALDPTPPAGAVTVKFVVDMDGTVSSSNIKSSSTGDSELDECLARAMYGAPFPELTGGGIVIVSAPLEVSP